LVQRDIETTMQLLECAREITQLKKFLYFSSDEVFGPKEVVCDFNSWDRYNSHSPYAAGKAACEELCLSWSATYGVPTVITHCQNLFGERQPANKFLPTVVRCALQGEPVPIYVGLKTDKRNFLHVSDACSAIVLLLKESRPRQKYNIASRFEISNEMLVGKVAQILRMKIKTKLQAAANVRPGYFVGHGLNGDKLEGLGWRRKPIQSTLRETVKWMVKEENRHWLGL
jgi:dTDP-glucose 4,6-dehydratase